MNSTQMTAKFAPDFLTDLIASSLVKATAVANRRVKEMGLELNDLLVNASPHHAGWRLSYYPKPSPPYQRGGDYIFEIDSDGVIQRELRGQ